MQQRVEGDYPFPTAEQPHTGTGGTSGDGAGNEATGMLRGVGEKLSAGAAKVKDRVRDALPERSVEWMRSGREVVDGHPYMAIAIAAAVGFVAGVAFASGRGSAGPDWAEMGRSVRRSVRDWI